MHKQESIVRLVVDKDAVSITLELARMAAAGEVSGLAFVLRTTHREYHVMCSGAFEENPVEAAGAASLLRMIAERRAADKVAQQVGEGKI